LIASVAVAGSRLTPPPARIVSTACAFLDGSACGVTEIVTVAGLGTAEGAAYVAVLAAAAPPADCCVSTVRTPQADPLHPLPDSCHVSAGDGFDPATGVSVAAIVAEADTGTLAGALSCSVKLLVIVSTAVACFEGSATLCAVRFTAVAVGKVWGAVKLPLASTVPQKEGHAMPESDQRTAVFGWPELTMEPRRLRVEPNSTAALVAERTTCTSLPIAMLALADLVVSARLVAPTCTFTFAGKSAGAVYTPAAVIVPTAAFPPGMSFTLQITLVSLLFATVARNL
jgi:hypothetical protein